MRPRCIATLLTLASLTATVAHAATPTAAAPANDVARRRRAQEMWKEGLARYNIDKQDEAIDFFTKAYEIYPFADILFNLAQAHRRKNDFEHARFYFLAYLREKPSADDRPQVEAFIHELEGLIAAQLAQADKPPTGMQEPPPTPAHPTGEPVTNPSERPAKLTIPAPPASQSEPPRAPHRTPAVAPWYADGWGWTLTAVGGVGVGIGVWALVDASSLSSAARNGDEASAESRYAKAHDRRVLGGITLAVGGTLLVTGIVKLILHEAPPSGLDVGLSRHGIAVGWSF